MVLSVFYGTVRHSFGRQLSLLKKSLPLNYLSLPPRLRCGNCPYLQAVEAKPVSLHAATAWKSPRIQLLHLGGGEQQQIADQAVTC